MVYVQIVKKRLGGINMSRIDLTQMKTGESGTVIELYGGYGMVTRLEAMGIRPGVMLTKVSSQIMRGPVIVKIGTTQVAIGFGMARKVIVRVD
jgi:ferrous iron transport protein A